MNFKKIIYLLIVVMLVSMLATTVLATNRTDKQVSQIAEAARSLSRQCRNFYSATSLMSYLRHSDNVYSSSVAPIEKCVARAERALGITNAVEKTAETPAATVTAAVEAKLTQKDATKIATDARYFGMNCRRYLAQDYYDYLFKGVDKKFAKDTTWSVSKCVAMVRPKAYKSKFNVKDDCRKVYSESDFYDFVKRGINQVKGGLSLKDCFMVE